VADSVAKVVDAVNAALAEIARTGSYDSTTKKAGVLHGDSAMRSLRSAVSNAVTGSSDSSPGLMGISVQRDGTIAFDRAKFLAQLEKDPGAVQDVLGEGGLATRLAAVADGASRSSSAAGGPGIITGAISSRERAVTALRADIVSWDQRLELRQQRLQSQFSALERALGAAQSQGQWLAGQIASLPSYGG
jgi:flagellar hook-associated protein 2